jgi:putative ABC transport system permease protein
MQLLRKLWYWIRRDRFAEDLEEEMRLHVELRAARLEREGLSPDAAGHQARRAFGNVAAIEERSTDMWGFTALDQLRQDLRFALRRVRQNPGFSIPIVLVLALGIGATTAVFSAVDAVFLRPLPFARPQELVTLNRVNVPFERERGEARSRIVDMRDVQEMPQIFSRSAAFASGGLNLSDPENPVRVTAGVVTAGFFTTLGVPPYKGRVFAEEEGKPNGPNATVLSHALWQRQYGGRDMIGRSIILHGKPYQVVGVMPPGFSFPNESDLWIPMSIPTTFATFEAFRGWLPSRVIARLAPGVPVEVASVQLQARWEQRLGAQDSSRRTNFREYVEEVRKSGAVIPLQKNLVGTRDRPLSILMGATVLLLLIACANVANLLLSDAARRRREIAVRQVLGATRRRIVRQLLAESVILSLGAALVGIALAPAALSLLRAMLPADLAGLAPAQLDLRVLGFATLLAVGTGIVFGLWPAVGAARDDASATIKSGGGHGATGRTGRARQLLVVAELALTVMLLVGAGLMIRSFQRVMSRDSGMKPERVATLEMSFARSSQGSADRLRVISGTLERLRLQPGIDAVGAVNDLPLRGSGGIGIGVEIPGKTHKIPESMQFARYLMASGGYFDALGIPLLRGRVFTVADDSLSPPVAIVSEATAKAYWPGADAIGRSILFGDTIPITVVGVVADVLESGLDREPGAQMYLSIHAQTPSNVAIVARSTLPPATLFARMTDAVRTVAPGQAIYNVRMMDEVVDKSVAPRRTNTLLIAIFAGLALVLAALGVYAVVAYSVAQRSREFGIRSALGATSWNLLSMVSLEMVAVLATGISLGLLGAWGLARVLTSLLYGVDMHDPITFAVVPLVLLIPAAIATIAPATRAMRVNPTEVMRAD